MSVIRRTLIQQALETIIAGPSGGGGIVMKPEKDQVICEESQGGGECSDDVFTSQIIKVAQGVDTGNPVITMEGTHIEPMTCSDYYFGAIIDTSRSVPYHPRHCCDIQWDLSYSEEGDVSMHLYAVISGVLFVVAGFGELGTATLVATPTVCGVEYPALTFVNREFC